MATAKTTKQPKKAEAPKTETKSKGKPKKSQSEKMKIAMEAYGHETMEELIKSEEFIEAFKLSGGSKEKAMDIILKPTFEDELRGWWIGHAEDTDYDRKAKTYTVNAVGSRIFFEDGEVRTVIDDVDRRQDEDGVVTKPMRTKVIAGPWKIRQDLVKETQRVNPVKENPPQIRVEDHDAEIPQCNAGEIVNRAMWRSKSDRDLGCVKGSAKGFIIGTTGDEESASVQIEGRDKYAEFDHVKVMVYDNSEDKDGNPTPIEIGVKVPFEIIEETFGVSVDDGDDVIKELVANRPIAAYLNIGVLQPLNYVEGGSEDDNSDFPDPAAVEARIEELREDGFIYEDESTGFAKLDLSTADKDTKYVDVCGYKVYDMRRNEDGEWTFNVPARQLQRSYWGSVRQREVQPKDPKKDSYITNEDCFFIFLDSLSEDDLSISDAAREAASEIPDELLKDIKL